MNDLQVFKNPEFGQIRAVDQDGEVWFVATDVCKALDITNVGNALARLDDDEKSSIRLTDVTSRGGNPNVSTVSEPGLYTLVLGSRKKEAKAFKRWITHDVIPSIRKTGSYSIPDSTPAALLPGKPQPEVSLTGLAKVANAARRAVLDMGGTRWEAGTEVMRILDYCGLPVPEFAKRVFDKQNFLELADFLR